MTESSYHIYIDKSKNTTRPNLPEVKYVQDRDEDAEHPLSKYKYTQDDKKYMRVMLDYLMEYVQVSVKSPIETFGKDQQYKPNISLKLPNGNETLRCIFNNFERLIELKQFYCVGFFGCKSVGYEKMLDKIIESDEILVSNLVHYPSILAYVTIERDSSSMSDDLQNKTASNWGNIVVVDNLDVVQDWRSGSVHKEAVEDQSPYYYQMIRLHNASISIPSSHTSEYQSLRDYLQFSRVSDMNLQVIRTKYYQFQDGKLIWRGLRTYQQQDSISSQTILCTSFLGSSTFSFYKEILEQVGRDLDLNIKVIDVYSLEESQWKDKEPYKIMIDLGISFAFMCGLAFLKGSELLTPMVSVVKSGNIYQDKSNYYSLLITNKSNENIKSLKDCRGMSFAYNEEYSFSGYQLPLMHLRKSNLPSSSSFEEYFSSCHKTSSHLQSLTSICNNQYQVSSIDSVVYDCQYQNDDKVRETTKIIEIIGPYPMPPLVKLNSLALFDKSIQNYLTSNLFQQKSNKILEKYSFTRFVKCNNDTFQKMKVDLNL
ncbi:hypothetical protein DLAC_04889 [Tieghemostelium lacteum]|uniref:Uncharacterized protein n=1 Tax=Tieghemostelium lacteum TaxID=361077 RepID=A0A151ZJK8_TIELA|nr:hypothetical protein DLAC_04889 [Tieghemostelium lacteum]|eukprot:KYQ93994.1 hypothetical protein DLAC_04889 [Tieghemostelium lacteum]